MSRIKVHADHLTVYILCFVAVPPCFLLRYVPCFDREPQIVLSHGKCPATLRQSIIQCAHILSQCAAQ